MNKHFPALIAGVCLLAALAAGAVAADSSREMLAEPSAEAPTKTIREAFPTFGEPPAQPDDVARIAELKRQFGEVPDENPIARADFTKSRSVKIGSSNAKAWLVPSGDNVCVFIPDPYDGYGAGCMTLTDIREGHGFSFLSGVENVYVVALVPEGDEHPSVSSKSDPGTRLAHSGNASAGIVPRDAVITTSNGRLDLKRTVQTIDKPAP